MQSTQSSANKNRILLLTGAFNYSEDEITRLGEASGLEVIFHQDERTAVAHDVAEKVVATVCNGLFLYNSLDRFPNLRLVQLTSAGHDRIPEKEMLEKGIRICDARGVYSTPMAEWAVAVVLSYYKNLYFFMHNQRQKVWAKDRNLRELKGRKVAVVGAGNVGREVARKFNGLDTIVEGFDIRPYACELFKNIRHIESLADNIKNYDIVVITAPATPETYHLFNERILSNMKDGAMLINISRGTLIDEQALVKVLTNRPDMTAALDVFETEPLNEQSELWGLPNCMVSPHNPFVGNGNHARLFDVIRENLNTDL